MTNKLIVYKEDIKTTFEKFFETYDISQTGNSSVFFITSKDIVVNELSDYTRAKIEASIGIVLSAEDSNGALYSIYSRTAPAIGKDRFPSKHKPTIFLLYQPHPIEMYFLKHYLHEVDATILLFIAEEFYYSNDYNENLKDYIPFMNFDEVTV